MSHLPVQFYPLSDIFVYAMIGSSIGHDSIAVVTGSDLVIATPVEVDVTLHAPIVPPLVLILEVVGIDVTGPIRKGPHQQDAVPTYTTRAAGRYYSTAVVLPLIVNQPADRIGPRGQEGTGRLRAATDVVVSVDLEGPTQVDHGLLASLVLLHIGIVLLLDDIVLSRVEFHRIHHPTVTAISVIVNCIHTVHHLLLREVQVHLVPIEEQTFDLSNRGKRPAGTTCALVLDRSHQVVRGIRVINRKDTVVGQDVVDQRLRVHMWAIMIDLGSAFVSRDVVDEDTHGTAGRTQRSTRILRTELIGSQVGKLVVD
jgi:hypothetical protein